MPRWCRLLRRAGGACDAGDLRLGRTGRPRPGRSSSIPARRAPPAAGRADRCAAVARALAAAGHGVVVTGAGAGERPIADAVVAGAGLPPAAGLGGRLDLPALAGLVRGARLVLSGDTGVAHLATA